MKLRARNDKPGAAPRVGGFTLAEVLAALVFMAIVIPAAIEGLSLAGRAGVVAARKNDAVLIADRILNETVVTSNWNQSAQSGVVHQSGRDFRWTFKNEIWNQDPGQTGLRLLSVEVSFTAQGQEIGTRLSTLVDTSTPLQSTNSTAPSSL